MTRLGFGPEGMARFASSSSWDDNSFPGFEELAMPLFDSLYNFARWLGHDQNDAEDLVQETYLKALRGFGLFQPGSNFRAWIFQILKNTSLSSRSKLERRMTVAMYSDEDFPELPATSGTPESLLIERSGVDAVRCAIEQLPDAFREVILLCDVEDASYREIAEILSIPMGTVMSRLARARKAVRDSLRSISVDRNRKTSLILSRRTRRVPEPPASRIEVCMITVVKLTISLLALAAACLAQESLTIDNKHKERVSTPEVGKIYSSACSVVQREFDIRHPVHPQVRLVLGADKNEAWLAGREIRLTKWDRYAFAQGVVWLAFEDLMPSQQRLTIAKRAVNWADSTVEIERLAK